MKNTNCKKQFLVSILLISLFVCAPLFAQSVVTQDVQIVDGDGYNTSYRIYHNVVSAGGGASDFFEVTESSKLDSLENLRWNYPIKTDPIYGNYVETSDMLSYANRTATESYAKALIGNSTDATRSIVYSQKASNLAKSFSTATTTTYITVDPDVYLQNHITNIVDVLVTNIVDLSTMDQTMVSNIYSVLVTELGVGTSGHQTLESRLSRINTNLSNIEDSLFSIDNWTLNAFEELSEINSNGSQIHTDLQTVLQLLSIIASNTNYVQQSSIAVTNSVGVIGSITNQVPVIGSITNQIVIQRNPYGSILNLLNSWSINGSLEHDKEVPSSTAYQNSNSSLWRELGDLWQDDDWQYEIINLNPASALEGVFPFALIPDVISTVIAKRQLMDLTNYHDVVTNRLDLILGITNLIAEISVNITNDLNIASNDLVDIYADYTGTYNRVVHDMLTGLATNRASILVEFNDSALDPAQVYSNVVFSGQYDNYNWFDRVEYLLYAIAGFEGGTNNIEDIEFDQAAIFAATNSAAESLEGLQQAFDSQVSTFASMSNSIIQALSSWQHSVEANTAAKDITFEWLPEPVQGASLSSYVIIPIQTNDTVSGLVEIIRKIMTVVWFFCFCWLGWSVGEKALKTSWKIIVLGYSLFAKLLGGSK